ncbi:MAG: TIGR01777 family oxidoreductase [Anaerolineales bacterium]|nr:TIGR01777 family oxidoreductase [Anaerolineales bacterium]MCX7754846.1 TIGR01777 family oxidoreductase [Anaerolineales bacterium]MDW8278726.1 TIGR01777 family oxidoreductase [Anaerolineales bacterium]
MNVLIAGGTGFLGSALTRSLLADGHQVWILTRNPARAHHQNGAQTVAWDGRTVGPWLDIFSQMDAVVNLTGENVGQWPWTAERKQRILSSRIEAGEAFVAAFAQAPRRPKVFLQASGVGYYGPRRNEPVDESASPGSDFFASVATRWEDSTRAIETFSVRRVILRTSLVLDAEGGILPLMALPVKFFLGGPLGSGKQGVSWIHLTDHVRAMRFLLENNKAVGAFNLTAPNPVSNAEFLSTLANALERPFWLPAPEFALRLVLGEMSTLLLDGQFAIPRRLTAMGFVFQYQTAAEAFRAIFQT